MSFNCGVSANQSFEANLNRYIGETVTIFTTSGGASGCGFTGVMISVNCDFVRLSTQQGTAPTNPLSDSICSNFTTTSEPTLVSKNHHVPCNSVGSVCDIPIDRIVALVHNAV